SVAVVVASRARSLPPRLLRARLADHPRRSTMDGPFRVPPDYEVLVQHVYEALLRPGDVAFDVGAHVGRHTAPMARCVGPTGRVLAFEPLPSCADELRRASAAGRVEIHDCALGATPGHAEFVVAVDQPAYSGLRERLYDAP